MRKWLFQKRAAGFEEMTDLPAELRERLAAEFQIWTTRVAQHRKAADGSEKLLLELHDAERIECVLLRDDKEHCTACISTQVGCAMGCVFCATGLDGVVRNLTRGEIVEQMLHLQRLLWQRCSVALAAERLSHVVVMGMGEPLLNLDALLPALAEAAARDGLGIGVRRITISTVGLPEGIRRLASENCQYHLAVSLHAANDALRNELVPANRGFGIAAILAAADEYFELTGRRVTFEYVLLAGVNDQPEHARQLVTVAARPAGAGEPDPVQSGARASLSHALARRHGPIRRAADARRPERRHPPSQGRPDRRRLRAVAAGKLSAALTAAAHRRPALELPLVVGVVEPEEDDAQDHGQERNHQQDRINVRLGLAAGAGGNAGRRRGFQRISRFLRRHDHLP